MHINIFLNTVFTIFFVTVCWCYTCPDNEKAVGVDLKQFVGEWYMVAGVPITGSIGSCLHFQITSNGSEFAMNFTTTSYRNGKRLLWRTFGEQFGNQLNGTWRLNTSTRILGPFRHQVLSIDYENHCAIVVCANNTKDIPKQIFAMIWSRDKTLPNNTLSKLKDDLSPYVDRQDILDADNTCAGITF